MIEAAPASTQQAFLDGAPTGLTGTLTWKLLDDDGTVIIAASTSGIAEIEPTVYRKEFTTPSTLGAYLIVWTNGSQRITEELVVAYGLPGVPPTLTSPRVSRAFQASSVFYPILEDAPSGLGTALTLGIRRLPDNVMVSPASSEGITEYPGTGSSNYQGIRTTPDAPSADPSPQYEVVWFVSGAENQTEDLYVAGTPTPADVTPSVDDVAALLYQRLGAGGGKVVPTFDTTTSPTAIQVQRLIDLWAPIVLVDFGDLSDDALICTDADSIRAAVRTLIAATVAKVIEVSYWPQDAVASDTAGDYWQELLDRRLPQVIQAAKECRLGEDVPGGGEGGGGISMSPTFQFNTGPRAGDGVW